VIKIKNMEPRIFHAQLERKPKEDKSVMREHHNISSGQRGTRIALYKTYEELCILAYQVVELDESVLENVSVKGAIDSKWLRIIK